MGTIRGNKRGGSASSGRGSGSSDVGGEWDFSFDIRPRRQQQNSILIVDDDPAQLNILQIMVERAGYKVSTADSAQAALSLMEEKQFNVVVSDFKMPEMNGFEFVKALRKLDAEWNAKEVPVIVLTACGEDIEFSALERGADMFCEKFRADSLLVKQIRFLLEM
jgi:CheY-like chemotaxis protein